MQSRTNGGPLRAAAAPPLGTRLAWSGVIGFVGAAAGGILALAPPIDELTHRSFAIHMLQHELFAFVIPPLSLLFAAAFPSFVKATSGPFLTALSRPLPALLIATGVLSAWHLPHLYDAALASDGVHIVEHATILLAFLLFWRPLVGRTPAALKSNLGRVAYLVVGAMPAAALGAFLSFHKSVLYSGYLHVRSPLLPPLFDQQLGGAIMWFSGAVVFAVAAALLLRDPG